MISVSPFEKILFSIRKNPLNPAPGGVLRLAGHILLDFPVGLWLMTDQSVTGKEVREEQLAREARVHPTSGHPQRGARKPEDLETIEDLVARCFDPGRPGQAALDSVGRWLTAARDANKTGTASTRLLLSRLFGAFQQEALKKNMDAGPYYASLLERLVVGSEPEREAAVPQRPTTMERILDAALEVFSEYGFHHATVDEIAERADVGKGTLYRYFANKETLFNELVRLRLEELERTAVAIWDDRDDVLTVISKYLRIYFEFFDRNQHLYRVIVQERPDVSDQVQDVYLKKIMRKTPHLKRKIYEATQRGALKDVDFQTVFYGVMGFVHGVIQKWLVRECSYSLVEELPGVVEVLFYGFVRQAERP